MANLYTYNYSRDNTNVPGVVDHYATYGFDGVDVATVHLLSDDRVLWKNVLNGQSFQIVRQSDSFVEFRGDIKEVRFESHDQYNLVLKVYAPSWRLADLDVTTYNAQKRVPRATTAFDATSITDTGGADEPPDDGPGGYVDADHAIMIVPASEGSFANEAVENSITSLGTIQSGTFADLNDKDPDTAIYSINTAAASEWIQFNGSSANAKATVTGFRYRVMVKTRVDAETTSIKLQFYDNNLASWEDLVTDTLDGLTSGTPYYPSEIELMGYEPTNELLDGSDDWSFRVLITKGGSTNVYLKIASVVIDIYTDNVCKSPYFSISSYASNSTIMNVNADPNSLTPVTGGVAVGDTYVIGMKDLTALTAMFALFNKYELPFSISIDANFVGYTTKDFSELNLLDTINYFCEKQEGHWYFNHDTNTLEIDKESTILTAAEHEIVIANIDTYGLVEKKENNVRSVTVSGATYKREPDETECQVSFTYPDDIENYSGGVYAGYNLKKLKVEEQNIRTTSEAGKLAESIFNLKNNNKPIIELFTNTFDEIWMGERLKVVIDGETYDTSYACSAVTISHNVGNNDIKQSVTGGWMGTPFVKRQTEFFNQITKDIRSLNRYLREMSQSGKTYLPSDGTVPVANLAMSNTTYSGTNIFTAGFTSYDDIVFKKGVGDTNPVTMSKTADATEFAFDQDLVMPLGKKVSAPTVEILNPDDGGADQTLVASGGAGEETVTVSRNFTCTTGVFAAASVKIGGQTLSETAGGLIISHAATPHFYLKDTGSSHDDVDFIMGVKDQDDATLFQISRTDYNKTEIYALCPSGKTNHLYVGTYAYGGNLVLRTGGSDRLTFTKAGDISFDASNVNFAGGTTYKVEADGDATFKDMIYSSFTGIGTGLIQETNVARPSATLRVGRDTATPVFTGNWSQTVLHLRGPSHCNFIIESDTDSDGNILFGDSGDMDIGKISYHHSSNSLEIKTNAATALTIDSTQAAIFTSNILLGTVADTRIRVPYLAAIPGSADNGSVWMEADGLHIYYNGAEKVIAGA